MTKTFNILQKVRKSWEMEETALIWRWLPAFPCGKACTAAPAEPRNDKSGGQLHPEGRIGKLAIASLPCHCEEGASPTRQSREGSCEFAGGFPVFRLHPARLPRLLRSLAMTNLGVPSSRVIARRAQARRGNLGKAVANSPEAFPCYGCILRDCHGSCGASQ